MNFLFEVEERTLWRVCILYALGVRGLGRICTYVASHHFQNFQINGSMRRGSHNSVLHVPNFEYLNRICFHVDDRLLHKVIEITIQKEDL